MKRKHKRVNTRYPCRIRVDYRTPRGKTRVGYTADVSAGGLSVLATKAPAESGPVELEIRLPQKREPLKLRGRITWGMTGHAKYGPMRGGFGAEVDTQDEGWHWLLATLETRSRLWDQLAVHP